MCRRDGWGGRRQPRPDTAVPEHLLGTAPDAVIAERSGVGRSTVHRLRTAAGIPSWAERRRQRLDACQDRLGIVDDAILARQTGYSHRTIRRQRSEAGIPSLHMVAADWSNVALDCAPTTEVADELGCSRWTVWRARAANDD